MSVRVEHDDCLLAIPRLVAEGVVCDAVVCDPPYNLTATAQRFGKSGSAPAKHGKDGAHQRAARGFMNSAWDTDIAFRPETWATVATVLRPGAFLVAFGGTRTYHRLTCAIEDAGFVIQDQLAWLFATGFPKRRDMLKPAHEPLVLAYKPGGKRTMQIDECRIAAGDGYQENAVTQGVNTARTSWEPRRLPRKFEPSQSGRWPANLAHDGSDEVLAAFPDSAGQLMAVGPKHGPKNSVHALGNFKTHTEALPRNDTGSAARFFFSAKADAQDRWGSRHPTVKPVELMKWLVALVTPPGGTCIDPFAGSGTTGVAALATGRNAILIEREAAYHADILERMAHYEGSGRHSLASKGRQAHPRGETPLFDRPYDETADAIGSYNDAVVAVGERVRAGAPLPDFFLSDKPEAAE